jgi:hypothetical protein
MVFPKSMTRALAIAMGLAGLLAVTSPSLAQASRTAAHSHARYYEPGDNGSAWSYYRGYTDQSSARGAYAQVPHYGAGRAVDDPPGSAFEDAGNARSMGCPC